MFLPSADFVLLLAPAGAVGQDTAGGLAEALGSSSAFPWGPVLLLAGPAVVAVTLLWFYARTARLLRRAQLAPPTWLLPYLEPPGGSRPAWPPPAADPDDAADQANLELSIARLGRRKRILLVGLALNFVAGWAAAGIYLYESNRTVEFHEFPSAEDLGGTLDTARFAGIEGRDPAPVLRSPPLPGSVGEPPPVEDTAAARVRREQRQAFVRRRDSLAEVRRLDSLAIASAAAARLRDSLAQAVRDSVARASVMVPPAPPPPAPPPPAAPPPPDPAVERAAAAAVARSAGQSLVDAVNGRSGLAERLVAGEAATRFVRFVEQSTLSARLESVAPPTVTEARAESVVTVAFQWRGPFGDTRRRSGRFRADLVRGPAGWRVSGLVPLDQLQ